MSLSLSDAILVLLNELGCCVCLNQDTGKYEARDRDNVVAAEFDNYEQIIEYAEEQNAIVPRCN